MSMFIKKASSANIGIIKRINGLIKNLQLDLQFLLEQGYAVKKNEGFIASSNSPEGISLILQNIASLVNECIKKHEEATISSNLSKDLNLEVNAIAKRVILNHKKILALRDNNSDFRLFVNNVESDVDDFFNKHRGTSLADLQGLWKEHVDDLALSQIDNKKYHDIGWRKITEKVVSSKGISIHNASMITPGIRDSGTTHNKNTTLTYGNGNYIHEDMDTAGRGGISLDYSAVGVGDVITNNTDDKKPISSHNSKKTTNRRLYDSKAKDNKDVVEVTEKTIRLDFNKIYNYNELLSYGNNAGFPHAILLNVPLHSITGLDPEPADWTDDYGNVKQYTAANRINKPIWLEFDRDSGNFIMLDGNHRYKQAKLNGDETITAFVYEPSKNYALVASSKLTLSSKSIQRTLSKCADSTSPAYKDIENLYSFTTDGIDSVTTPGFETLNTFMADDQEFVKLKAIIIRGKVGHDSFLHLANKFYKELAVYLEQNGYDVYFDDSSNAEPPMLADLWIGHCHSSNKFRFADDQTRLLAFDWPKMDIDKDVVYVNHPKDLSSKKRHSDGEHHNPNHYILTEKMKDAISLITVKIIKHKLRT